MLILDDDFKEAFSIYYDNNHPFEVPRLAEEYLNKLDSGLYSDIQNLLNTANVMGVYYYELYEEVGKHVSFRLPDGIDISLLVFNAVFFFMFHNNPNMLEHALSARFKPRDFYKDIAIQMYGVANEDTVSKINQPERHYSVDKSTPKNWDEWFYNMCLEVAANSKCYSRKIGAVLVRDKSIISTGYNGPPRGVPTCDMRWVIDKRFVEKYTDAYKNFLNGGKKTEGVCPRRVIGFPSGQGLEICPAGHAERNALINAARHGIKTKGTIEEPTTLYMSCGIPCSPCLVEIINSGVTEIVITGTTIYDQSAEYLLENSNLKIRLFSFLKI
jgi:dCMP deaminase